MGSLGKKTLLCVCVHPCSYGNAQLLAPLWLPQAVQPGPAMFPLSGSPMGWQCLSMWMVSPHTEQTPHRFGLRGL